MFISFFTTTNLIFLPMQYTGCSAYPRRIHDYPIFSLGCISIELLGIKGLLISALLII
jgi:heme/copper-type cytochrome/quinol oxidase subunit 1